MRERWDDERVRDDVDVLVDAGQRVIVQQRRAVRRVLAAVGERCGRRRDRAVNRMAPHAVLDDAMRDRSLSG